MNLDWFAWMDGWLFTYHGIGMEVMHNVVVVTYDSQL